MFSETWTFCCQNIEFAKVEKTGGCGFILNLPQLMTSDDTYLALKLSDQRPGTGAVRFDRICEGDQNSLIPSWSESI